MHLWLGPLYHTSDKKTKIENNIVQVINWHMNVITQKPSVVSYFE